MKMKANTLKATKDLFEDLILDNIPKHIDIGMPTVSQQDNTAVLQEILRLNRENNIILSRMASKVARVCDQIEVRLFYGQ